jgi:DinB superfamily
MKQSYIEENSRERERLRFLIESLSDEQLLTPLDAEWTIAVAFAHLAFWDQRSLILIRKWKKNGVLEPSPIDIEVINDALLPLWLLLAPREAANLAVSCAESIDRELEETAIDFVKKIKDIEGKSRVYRSIHRKMHLDQIEELINRRKTT